jgi:uncharacterized protein
MMRIRTFVLSIVAASLLAGAALAAEIAVHGTGTVWTEPDQATLEVGWSGVEAEVAAAVAQADAAITAIRAALEAVGIDPLDVRTTGFSIWREERWDETGEPRLVGFRVHHGLQVLIRDVEALGRTIAAATDAGANQIGGIGFTVADPHALETEARAAAFAAARARAIELADLMGVQLGRATVVEELDPSGVHPLAFQDGRGAGGPIAPGRYAVEVTVRVTFATSE